MASRPQKTTSDRQRPTAASSANQVLRTLGISSATARIVTYFMIRPDARPHLRQLQRLLGLGGASVQREMSRLVSAGALVRIADGRLVKYAMSSTSPIWAAFRLMVRTVSDPTDLIHDALLDVSGVHAAFVFGSMAGGTQRDDSDVDVFIVESATVDRRALLRQLAEVGVLTGREIDPVRYTLQAIAERLGDSAHPASHFIHDVLAGDKRWVAGNAEPLLPLATAAGVQMRDALTAAVA